MQISILRLASIKALVAAGLIIGSLVIGTSPAWAIGAIAVDDEEGQTAKDVGYGIGHGDTKEAAFAEAKSECKKAGNTDCKGVVWYTKCGAYAASSKNSGIGTGATEDIAKKKAVSDCGVSACKVAVSACE